MQNLLFANIRNRKPGNRTRPQTTPEAATLAGKRVVIVEDEGITHMVLHRILLRAGMEVVASAMDGPAGVEAVLLAKPDLVLMDIRMPGEYDGLEAARRILAEQSVCIVMLTAFSDDALRQQAQEMGVSGYLIKPVDQEMLLPRLKAALTAYRRQ
jgi:response regulator NasT